MNNRRLRSNSHTNGDTIKLYARTNQKLSEIAQRLWDLDVNRFIPHVDYELDLQKEAISDKCQAEDLCDRPLFSFVNESKLQYSPTYSRFIHLLDNYKIETRNHEMLTHHELAEESAFLDACIQTPVMQETLRFLAEEGKINYDPQELKDLLSDIWFTFYGRSAASEDLRDSSAFEHVFVGEIKQGGVLGCHNWIQFYLLEKSASVDYYGYFPKDSEYIDNEMFMLGCQFVQSGRLKALGGFLIGVSPEFELALYTIAFLCSGQRTKLSFAGIEIVLNCYKMERDNDVCMATLFASKN